MPDKEPKSATSIRALGGTGKRHTLKSEVGKKKVDTLLDRSPAELAAIILNREPDTCNTLKMMVQKDILNEEQCELLAIALEKQYASMPLVNAQRSKDTLLAALVLTKATKATRRRIETLLTPRVGPSGDSIDTLDY